MEEKLLKFLKKLALLEDLSSITLSDLSNEMDVSAQTLSRWLRKLENKKLIKRRIYPRGQNIMITKEGWSKLRKEYYDYRKIFDEEKKLELVGEIVDGLGEGQYYISQEGYQKQFEHKLGFRAYPGTLNVELKDESTKKVNFLKETKGTEIEGFKMKDRTFGGAKCFSCKTNGFVSAIIFPERSNYDDEIIEIISPYKLREKIEDLDVRIEVKK